MNSFLKLRRSLVTFGVLGLLTWKHTMCTSAAIPAISKTFQPMFAKYPDMATYQADSTNADMLFNFLIRNSSALRQQSESDRKKIFSEYHYPTYVFVRSMLHRYRATDSISPFFLGISAPQVE
jgi:hypothetical protein